MWLVIAILIVAVHIYTIVDVLNTPAYQVNVIPKKFWSLIMLIPVIGPLLWFFFGQRNAFLLDNRRYNNPRNAKHPTAPDDDPEFLRILEIKKRQREEAKRLEEWRKDLQQREQKLSEENDQDKGSDPAPRRDN